MLGWHVSQCDCARIQRLISWEMGGLESQVVIHHAQDTLIPPKIHTPPQISQDYPLNLSISVSGGKETNKDSPSNGE